MSPVSELVAKMVHMRLKFAQPAALAAVVLSMVVAAGPSVDGRQAASAKKIDAVTLALAVRDGKAKQYEGFTVTGEGRSFDTNCVPADPEKKTDALIPLGLGVLGKDGKLQTVATLEDWINLQMVGRPQILVNLKGPALKIKPETDPQHPVLYTFIGVFTGETAQVTPAPSIMDNNPKSFTVAVLKDATAK